jgi:hypothetical protein
VLDVCLGAASLSKAGASVAHTGHRAFRGMGDM